MKNIIPLISQEDDLLIGEFLNQLCTSYDIQSLFKESEIELTKLKTNQPIIKQEKIDYLNETNYDNKNEIELIKIIKLNDLYLIWNGNHRCHNLYLKNPNRKIKVNLLDLNKKFDFYKKI